MFEDCGRKERERKKKRRGRHTRRHDCEDEGDRGRSGGEGQKDGELKEAGKDAGGGGDRMTLGGGIKKTDQDVSWDFAGIFSNRNLDFKALRMCGLCSASQPRLTFR